MPNAVVANQATTTTTTASIPTNTDRHVQLQRLLVRKEGEVVRYRDRAEEAEHKLQLVNVSR